MSHECIVILVYLIQKIAPGTRNINHFTSIALTILNDFSSYNIHNMAYLLQNTDTDTIIIL